jgi:hypothetical protein
MASEKPFSPASERNRDPILEVLRVHFAGRRHVLEIGSGTGQHAVHFAAAMPWLVWQCSDRAEYLPGIRAWLDEAALPNTPAPAELDVASTQWPLPGALLPLPPAGEGWGEGALDLDPGAVMHKQDQDQERPHPAFGRLLPQAGEVSSSRAGERTKTRHSNRCGSAAKPTTTAPLSTLTMPVRLITLSKTSMLCAAQVSRNAA